MATIIKSYRTKEQERDVRNQKRAKNPVRRSSNSLEDYPYGAAPQQLPATAKSGRGGRSQGGVSAIDPATFLITETWAKLITEDGHLIASDGKNFIYYSQS
jgi:hypothetical protein